MLTKWTIQAEFEEVISVFWVGQQWGQIVVVANGKVVKINQLSLHFGSR